MLDQTDTAAKRGVIAELGVDALLLPAQVNAALEANDRAKYLLTLLQAARNHGDEPSAPAETLADERMAAEVVERALDGVVAASRREPDGTYVIPSACTVHDRLWVPRMRFRRSRGDLVFVEEAAEPVIPAKRGQVDAARRLSRY